MRLVHTDEGFAVFAPDTELPAESEVIFDGDDSSVKQLWQALTAYFTRPTHAHEDLKTLTDRDLIEAFIALRDRKEAQSALAEAKDKTFKKGLESISAVLLERQREQGIDAIKVKGVGTAFRAMQTKVSCADWDVFHNWLTKEITDRASNGGDPNVMYSFFQRRLTLDTVKQYMEANEGTVPPAVNAVKEYVINVRRS